MPSIRFLVVCLALLAGLPLYAQREKLSLADLKIVEAKWPEAKKTVTGLRYIVQAEGKGEPPKPGDVVSFLYRGTFLDGTVFDEDWNRVKPFAIRVGRSLVIQGMDQGLRMMKEGSRMILIVPPELAYGSKGDPPKIKPSSTLVFELELIEIKRTEPAVPPPPAKKK